MNISSVGWRTVCESDFSYFSEQDGMYFLLLSESRILIDDVEYPENTLILWDGSSPVSFSAVGAYLVYDWVYFSAENDGEFTDSLEIPVNTPIFSADTEFISSLIRNINSEFYSLNVRRVKMIDTMLRTLLIKIEDSCFAAGTAQTASEPYYSRLNELREMIYRNPQMHWNVNAMAEYMNMSRSYFQHIYHDTFGVSCMTDVINGKIEKAKEILSETDCTVSQVSAMCGYESEEHFMRQFKKITGTTPTKYRKNKSLFS